MANEFSIEIEGYHVKELRCKNDSCRKLIGYENIRLGVFVFSCPECQYVSIFNMKYKTAKNEFIEKLQKQFPEGVNK